MLQNYFKIAWRNLVSHRFYSLVNILGLAMGLTFSFLAGGYVWHELQVNGSIKNVANQYIIQSKWKDPNIGFDIVTMGPLAKALKTEYPNLVKNYYRYDGVGSTVSKGNKHFREGLQLGDSTMLAMFGFPVLHGDAKTALNQPYSVVITADKAIKYFDKTDVVGQTITIESFSGTKRDFTITAVLKSIPYNTITHLVKGYENQIFLPLSALDFFSRNGIEKWDNIYIASYIELQKGITPNDLQQPIMQLVKQNAPAKMSTDFQPQFLSLREHYLLANNGLVKKMLYTLCGIALFILLMAVINFINISISRSGTRMREIGVRKVMGGLRKHLLLQFLIESVVLAACATALAVLLYTVLRNQFANMLGTEVPRFSDYPVYFAAIPLLIALMVGTLAGLYPAFVLSSLKAVDSLKGRLKKANENIAFRKSLVGFQFCIATIVFIGAFIISKQVALFFGNNLGYDKDYVVSAKLPRDWTPQGVRHMEAMRNDFARLPQLKAVSLSFEIPDGGNAGSIQIYRHGADSTSAITVQQLTSDENYASVYGIPMQSGVFFKTPSQPVDSSKIVINETTAKALGWQNPSDAIGRQVRIAGAPFVLTVSGVTSDFHFGSMQTAIAPVVFLHVQFGIVYRLFSFKLKPGDVTASIAAVQKKWASVFPDAPFEYTFMDDDLKRIYQSELQLKKASYTAAGLAFVIVLLGVVGLVSLSIQRRTKEIGIRKVLGASVAGILSLFLKEFLLIAVFAGIAACPVAYLIMQGWLDNYAYRIPVTAQPFVAAIVVLALVTAALISMQTAKAALDNPVKSLRTE